MKKFVLLFVGMVLLSSCHQTKLGMVKDFLETINSMEKGEINKYLSDSFMYYGKDTLNKDDYLSLIDSLMTIEYNYTIQSIQGTDSVVNTEEIVCSIIDSLLEVNPKIIQFKTYKFSNDKLASITVDSILNQEEYSKSLSDKLSPFIFYVKDQNDIQDDKEITTNIKKYLSDYLALPVSDKKEYRTYGHLQGTFVSKNCPYYRKLYFRGKKTVTIVDAIFGLSFTTSYEIDDNLVRIKTDKSDLLFEFKDSNTLIGEGFAKGTFTKLD